MARVLILATRHDRTTHLTHRWAQELDDALVLEGHITVFRGGSAVSSSALSDLASFDWVFFFGHGEPNRLVAQPLGKFIFARGRTLVDSSTIRLLQGKPISTICCHALSSLGGAYAGTFPGGTFLGYAGPFGLNERNQSHFAAIVKRSAMDLVNGVASGKVAADQKQEWESLYRSFMGGALQHRPDAWAAGYAASGNAAGVGVRP